MPESVEMIAQELCHHLTENVLAESVVLKASTSFEDLGLDSFSIVDLVLLIERKYGVEIPDEQLTAQNLQSAQSLAVCTFSLLNS